MKKYLHILFLIFAIGFVIYQLNSDNEGNEEKEANKVAEQIERDSRMEEILNQIENSVSAYNATVGWEKELVDSTGYRSGSIFTIELEDIWLTDNPLLFYGTIEDISTINNGEALVEFDIDTYSQNDVFLHSDLNLHLTTDLETARQFLESYSKTRNGILRQRYVAIIATISSVDNKKMLYAEEDYDDIYIEDSDIKIGKGRILDMVYIGDYITFQSISR